MKNIDTLEEILDDLDNHIIDGDFISVDAKEKAKQALNLYIEERERLARIAELRLLKQYDSFNKAYTTDTRCATLVDIRIKELEG